MPKITVNYCPDRPSGPLSFWVHKAIDAPVWSDATEFSPPLPNAAAGKGYPVYELEFRGHNLVFCSKEEIAHCIAVLSQKVLPTTKVLAAKAGAPDYQHRHWLSTWPGDIKSWKHRQRIVTALLEWSE